MSHLILVVLMFCVMMIAAINFGHLAGSVERILRDNYDSVRAAQVMKETLERQDSAASFVLAGEIELGRRQFETNEPLFTQAYNFEAHNITEPGEQEMADAIHREYTQYQTELRRFIYANPPLSKQRAHDEYFRYLKPEFIRIKDFAQAVLDVNQSAIKRATDKASRDARRSSVIAFAVTIGSFVTAVYFTLRITRVQLAPLTSLARQAEQIGAGHWNQRIELNRTDEIGVLADSLNAMAEKLQQSWRREAERLHRAEQMSDAALENLYDPVVVTDAQGDVVFWNHAASSLFGPLEHEIGRPIAEAIKNDVITRTVSRTIQQKRATAAEDEGALVSVPVGGSHRTYRVFANPMYDRREFLGAVVVLEDITHLRELDRLKTEFIGVASHELRTPVTSLMLAVQLMDEGAAGALSPEQTEIVRAQREDLGRLERIISDLLDLTKLEAGVTTPRFELVAPYEIAHNAIRAVSATASAKGVALNTDYEPDLPAVRADRAQITRVLVNLLNNAIRHTPADGMVTVQLSLKSADDHDARKEDLVEFAVRDTGCGIPPEFVDRIFDRFVQVPGATRGGAGLGLSIAGNIIAAHGGEIHAESDIGQGSCFIFTLPQNLEVNPEPHDSRKAEDG